jgi:integrase/recombinase XerD
MPRCQLWCGRGRRVRGERPAWRGGRLSHRPSHVGFKLAGAGRLLKQFVDFADAADTDTITTQLAVQWATLPSGGSSTWHAQRLNAVRCFARWVQAFDPAIEVPPVDLLPARTGRATPYLYSDADVAALMAGAGRLRSPLAAATMQTFIGLVFATGLRRDRPSASLTAAISTRPPAC